MASLKRKRSSASKRSQVQNPRSQRQEPHRHMREPQAQAQEALKQSQEAHGQVQDVRPHVQAKARVTTSEVEQTFRVSLPQYTAAEVKARSRSKKNCTDTMVETDCSGKPITFEVSPSAQWRDLVKYRSFTTNQTAFSTGDYVLVKPAEDVLEDDPDAKDMGWVAKILEIRAENPQAVFVRITWLYWPGELPNGPETYHGEQELIMSNHMQIIDAQTIDDLVTVKHIVEDERDAKPVVDYYWRQTLDFATSRLSNLKQDCMCGRYHNPDTLLIGCERCHEWQHEHCVVKKVMRAKWEQRMTENTGTRSARGAHNTVASDVLNSITGNHKSRMPPRSKHNTTARASARLPPTRKSMVNEQRDHGRGQRNDSSRSNLKKKQVKKRQEEAWHGVPEGHLERISMSRDTEDAEMADTNITGNVIIADNSDTSGATEIWPGKCVHCNELLMESSNEE